jgi:hypothetical protein
VITAIVSDLHLGLGSGADLARQEGFRARLLEALDGVDRLILLGDVLELRDRPLPWVLEAAAPAIGALGEVMAGREVIVVPGNHDHHLLEPWLERRRLEGGAPLELEQSGEPEGRAFEALCSHAAQASVRFAYPGLWVREDVYATHGHYLDRHLTVPTVERLGVGAVERVLGMTPSTGPDPLVPPEDREPAEIDEYERVQTPVYAFLFALAQATPSEGRGAASPSIRSWAGAKPARHGCAAGSSARWRSPALSASPIGSGSARSGRTSRPERSVPPASRRWAKRSTTCGSTPTT